MVTTPTIMLHMDAPSAALEIVRAAHPDLTVHSCTSYDELPDALARTGADIVYTVRFAGTLGFPRQSLVDNSQVKWVCVGGSGTDHLAPWDAAQVSVTNSAGVAAGMMAEYALGAMLHFSLDLSGFATAQRSQTWIAGKVTPIESKTVLIVGLGHTGQAAAQRFKAMEMTVLGVRARPAPTDGVDEVHGIEALDALLPRADFVLVCVPLLDSTRGLIGSRAFAAMKPGAALIDVSRGGVVDETALLDALDSKRLGGAALDVFATEPLPPGHPLWNAENVIVTPHCSSVFDGWELKSVAMFSDNLTRYRNGEPLTNIVDPARGY